jgi:hypothetical protein
MWYSTRSLKSLRAGMYSTSVHLIDVLKSEYNAEIGAFQIIMDNLNIQQKTSHKTLETRN